MFKPLHGYIIAVISTIAACALFQHIGYPSSSIAKAATATATVNVSRPCAVGNGNCTELPSGRVEYKFMRKLRGGTVELLRTEVVYQKSN